MFTFSKRSFKAMEGVHPDLIAVAEKALEYTKVDFAVIEGIRSPERQAEMVAAGASRTLDGRHITGHAIDVMAFIGKTSSWDWPLYVTIAEAFQQASIDLEVPVRWGGCWGILSDIEDLDDAVAEYVARKRSQKKKPLMDGPHYELSRTIYP